MNSQVVQPEGVEAVDQASVEFRCNPEVMAQAVDGGAVLVHMITNRIYELNITAARLWGLLADGPTLGELYARLQSEFEVDPDMLEQEVSELVTLLLQEHLVVAYARS